jgi:pimeloyl-ACP methyl ester carboxylesterase
MIKTEQKTSGTKKAGKILLILAAVIAGVLLILTAAVTLWLPSAIMTGTRQTLDEAFAWQSDHYDTSFYGELKKTEYTVSAENGYLLHAELLENPEPSSKYVILSHGYTDNRMGSLKYVPAYLELGFNCIVYDLRGHGENEPDFTTYGVREGADLNCLITDTRARYPGLTVLGLHGESLGAATTVSCLKYRPQVDFAVADCGFSDIGEVLKEGYRSAGGPAFLIDLADLGARIRYGYAIRDMKPVDSLDGNEVPILFIHGEEDRFILPKNSEEMARRTKGPAEVRLMPGAGHAESVLTDPAQYLEFIRTFLSRIG